MDDGWSLAPTLDPSPSITSTATNNFPKAGLVIQAAATDNRAQPVSRASTCTALSLSVFAVQMSARARREVDTDPLMQGKRLLPRVPRQIRVYWRQGCQNSLQRYYRCLGMVCHWKMLLYCNLCVEDAWSHSQSRTDCSPLCWWLQSTTDRMLMVLAI